MSFRLNGKHLFLTYPQCGTLPVDAERVIRDKLANYECSIWGRESHADGSPHLHAFVILNKRTNLTSPNCLDIVKPDGTNAHGDYRVARSPLSVLDYVTKAGNVECFLTTLDECRAKFTAAGRKRTATQVILDEMESGKTLTQAATEHPEHLTFCMLHADRLRAFFTQTILDRIKPPKRFVSATAVFGESHQWDLSLATWLTSNLTNPSRPLGSPQLWLCGPTMSGKTTMLMKLAECFRVYVVPDEDFYDDYSDERYDLIAFDEYRHQKTIQWMNRFVDGQTAPIRQKGHQTVKRRNLPVIVLSNFRMRESYPNVEQTHFDTLARRFKEIWLEKPINIEINTEEN